MFRTGIDAARSEALFVSALQPSDRPGVAQVREAVARAVLAYGVHGCAERVAQEFGDHPDTAVARMLWSRRTVAEAFVVQACVPARLGRSARVMTSSPRTPSGITPTTSP